MSISTLQPAAAMSDAECLRFYNGMVAAQANGAYSFSTLPATARQRIECMMDLLAERGMVATVGYAGTPIIRPLVAA